MAWILLRRKMAGDVIDASISCRQLPCISSMQHHTKESPAGRQRLTDAGVTNTNRVQEGKRLTLDPIQIKPREARGGLLLSERKRGSVAKNVLKERRENISVVPRREWSNSGVFCPGTG